MKSILQSVVRSAGIAAALAWLVLASHSSYAQGANPELLQQLDNLLMDLEAIDADTEVLENPSLGDKILDAMSFKICGKIGGSASIEGKLTPRSAEVEGGFGIGPNVMGTGVAVKLEPKLSGNIALAVQAKTSVQSSLCLDVYKLAKVIQAEVDAAENGANFARVSLAATDPELRQLEDFALLLSDDAKQQILQFADFSPGDLLELAVMVLKDVGIDPRVDPEGVSTALLSTVGVIRNSTMNLSPSDALDFDRFNSIVQRIPIGSHLRAVFEEAGGAFTNLTLSNLDPCRAFNYDLPRALSEVVSSVCGIRGLVSSFFSTDNFFTILDNLDGPGGLVTLGNQGFTQAQGFVIEAFALRDRINRVFGDAEGAFNGVRSRICKTYGASAGALSCSARVSFNPCVATSVRISLSC